MRMRICAHVTVSGWTAGGRPAAPRRCATCMHMLCTCCTDLFASGPMMSLLLRHHYALNVRFIQVRRGLESRITLMCVYSNCQPETREWNFHDCLP